MGRGESTTRLPMDIGQHIFDTLQHIMIPISDDTIPMSLEQNRSPDIIT